MAAHPRTQFIHIICVTPKHYLPQIRRMNTLLLHYVNFAQEFWQLELVLWQYMLHFCWAFLQRHRLLRHALWHIHFVCLPDTTSTTDALRFCIGYDCIEWRNKRGSICSCKKMLCTEYVSDSDYSLIGAMIKYDYVKVVYRLKKYALIY